MSSTITTLRLFFFLLAVFGGYLVWLAVPEWEGYRALAMIIGALLGGLVILVDILLKGFSLRGLTALTFGIFVGWLMAFFLSSSPLFEHGDPQLLFIARLATFVSLMYLGSVIALRGKDEFNLVIPYVRFVPHQVDVPLAVVDTSALIDGRLTGLCESRFLVYGLVIPRFVIQELQHVADSPDPHKRARGRKGLETLNALRSMEHVDLRIHESDLARGDKVDEKLVFLAQAMKAKLLTTDFNLAQVAQFHNVPWLNLNALNRALNPQLVVGESVEIDLVRPGKEPGQAVGYLPDGSMVVVTDGREKLGARVHAEVQSIIPSAGGKMIFANLSRNGAPVLPLATPKTGKTS